MANGTSGALKGLAIPVENGQVRPGRYYVVALIVTALIGLGYVGVTHFRVAEARATARQDAREAAADEAEQTVFYKRASAVLAQVPVPRGFFEDTSAPCVADGLGESRCFLSATEPRNALARALAALEPLGLTLRRNACDDPSKLPSRWRAAMGRSWLPCSAYGRISGLDVSVVAFPALDHTRSTKNRIVFSGTKVSVEFIKPLG